MIDYGSTARAVKSRLESEYKNYVGKPLDITNNAIKLMVSDIGVLADFLEAAQARIDALESAARKHAPRDGRFACYTCGVDYRKGTCRECRNSRNWKFDQERFAKK